MNEYDDVVGMTNCKCQNNQVPLPDKLLKRQFCISSSSASPLGVDNHVGLSNDPSTSAVIGFITVLSVTHSVFTPNCVPQQTVLGRVAGQVPAN